MIKDIYYFDYDHNFVCRYKVVDEKPILKSVCGNALYDSLRDFYNSRPSSNIDNINNLISRLNSTPDTLVVVGGIGERNKTIPDLVDDMTISYHQKNRLHYGTREIYPVVKGALKNRIFRTNEIKDWLIGILEVFGPEEMHKELMMFLGKSEEEFCKYVREFFEGKSK